MSQIAEKADFGIWTDHHIPEERSAWHPMVRSFYEYWLSVTPPGRLPGRQHMRPEEITPMLSRMWVLDVFRNPLRLRYRLVGTHVVQSIGRELTGQWFDEAHPDTVTNPTVRDRHRFVVETGCPTWRRGPIHWERDPAQRIIENCQVPLASDGMIVDKIACVSAVFGADGSEL